jgi:hypothetical protein
MIEVELPDGTIAEFPAGTPDATIKTALQRYRTPAAPPPSAPPLASSIDDIDGGNLGERFRAGIGHAVDRTLDGATQLYLKARGEDSAVKGLETNLAEKRRLDEPLMDSWGGKLGHVAGEGLQMAIPAGKAMGATQKALKTVGGLKKTLAVLGAAGATNAGYEALKPTVGPDESRGENAAFGFGTGMAGQGIANVMSKGIGGLVKLSRHARSLPKAVQDESSLGQLVDRDTYGGRMISGIEEKAKSWPLVGPAIRNVRERGMDAWRNNVISEAAPPGFTPPTGGTMRETIGSIGDQFDDQYRAALGNVRVGASSPFEARVMSKTNDPTNGLTAEQNAQVRETVSRYYNHIFGMNQGLAPGATRRINSEQAKKFEAYLTSKARQYRASKDPQAQDFAKVFDDIEHAWTVAYRSQLPLATRRNIKPIDDQYSKFKTVERASTAVGNDVGEFTPNQLLLASKNRSTTPQFARGEGSMQSQADAGKHVYQDKIPNSGTADRGLAAGAAVGLLVDPISTLSLAGGGAVGLLPALTTKIGKNALTGNTKLQSLLKQMKIDEAIRNGGFTFAQALDGADYSE